MPPIRWTACESSRKFVARARAVRTISWYDPRFPLICSTHHPLFTLSSLSKASNAKKMLWSGLPNGFWELIRRLLRHYEQYQEPADCIYSIDIIGANAYERLGPNSSRKWTNFKTSRNIKLPLIPLIDIDARWKVRTDARLSPMNLPAIEELFQPHLTKQNRSAVDYAQDR